MAEPFFLTSIPLLHLLGLTEAEIQNVPSGEMLKILPVSGGKINRCTIASQKGRQGKGLRQTDREREQLAVHVVCVRGCLVLEQEIRRGEQPLGRSHDSLNEREEPVAV